ncbi:hypothetical protein [Kitasatospora sp. NPDC085879]|uniref:hypothetical protein n=1 Tax=Kitasatospora sp. NPDC085879 TaxID=3154769 RepID=UPI00343F38B7
MDDVFDARGIKASVGGGAQGGDGPSEGPVCRECGTALRATGPGPVYCSRSCSSKAYRRRRTEGQQHAVADALIASRVETADGLDDGAHPPTTVARRGAAAHRPRVVGGPRYCPAQHNLSPG